MITRAVLVTAIAGLLALGAGTAQRGVGAEERTPQNPAPQTTTPQPQPGMAEMIPEGEDPEVALKRVQGMIDSMSKKERRDPDLIDQSRRRRIAAGAGVEPHEVKQFLQQFDQVRALMKQMASMSIWQRLKMVTGLGKMGAFTPGGMAQLKTKGNTGKRKSAKERAEDRKRKKRR